LFRGSPSASARDGESRSGRSAIPIRFRRNESPVRMSLPVAILAGGKATRLGPIAQRMPKSLVDVAGRPFALHQIELLRGNGFTDLVFLVGHLGDVIRETVGNGAQLGVHIRYVFDGPRALGTGGAIRRALGCLGEAFFVVYG